MRKLLFFVLVLLMAGCKNKTEGNVYHTFYGDIDIDTIEAVEAWGDPNWYPVATTMLEDTMAHAMGLKSMWEIIYYSPAQNSYFFELFGSDGGSSGKFTFDPYDGKSHTMKDYYRNKGGE